MFISILPLLQLLLLPAHSLSCLVVVLHYHCLSFVRSLFPNPYISFAFSNAWNERPNVSCESKWWHGHWKLSTKLRWNDCHSNLFRPNYVDCTNCFLFHLMLGRIFGFTIFLLIRLVSAHHQWWWWWWWWWLQQQRTNDNDDNLK